MEYSKVFIVDLIEKIDIKLREKYGSHSKVELYIKRWQKVIGCGGWNCQEEEMNFYIIYKNDNKIDLLNTLQGMEDELLIKMSIDLEIEVPNIIYSVAQIQSIRFDNYKMAARNFNNALKNVYKEPEISIGLANTTLESIIKHILESGLIEVKNYNKNDTLYKQTQNILKAFSIFPNKDLEQNIKQLSHSLLSISQAIESLRSDKTSFHGKGESEYLIDDPLYSVFVINIVSTIGFFLISYFEKKYNIQNEEVSDIDTSDIPF